MGDVHPAIDVELKKLLPPESYELRPNDRDSRSLFGEILDWMLAPLLLLWPMSIAVTYLVAQSIANAPFDRSLENSVQAIGEQIKVESVESVLDEDNYFNFSCDGSHTYVANGIVVHNTPNNGTGHITTIPGQVSYVTDTGVVVAVYVKY
jgi:hypothetical protein